MIASGWDAETLSGQPDVLSSGAKADLAAKLTTLHSQTDGGPVSWVHIIPLAHGTRSPPSGFAVPFCGVTGGFAGALFSRVLVIRVLECEAPRDLGSGVTGERAIFGNEPARGGRHFCAIVRSFRTSVLFQWWER